MTNDKPIVPFGDINPVNFVIDTLRTRLRPNESVGIIQDIEEILLERWPTLTKNQIDSLKLIVDIQFRKLAKIMPDLKMMDHSMGETAAKVNFIINVGPKTDDTETKII
jgi:hypothetical protein